MRYKALTTINHDGVVYAIGEAIELADAEAAELLGIKAIELWEKPFVKHPKMTALHRNTLEH